MWTLVPYLTNLYLTRYLGQSLCFCYSWIFTIAMFIMANHGEKTAAMAISCYEYICTFKSNCMVILSCRYDTCIYNYIECLITFAKNNHCYSIVNNGFTRVINTKPNDQFVWIKEVQLTQSFIGDFWCGTCNRIHTFSELLYESTCISSPVHGSEYLRDD